jgi:hypothetical protein|tara:strand:- start:108 stop:431 length:324 start_codon:yes stop_codon:yes gene_type:complete
MDNGSSSKRTRHLGDLRVVRRDESVDVEGGVTYTLDPASTVFTLTADAERYLRDEAPPGPYALVRIVRHYDVAEVVQRRITEVPRDGLGDAAPTTEPDDVPAPEVVL